MAHRSLEVAGEGMKARRTSIFIFAEGTRHSQEVPDLLPFKKGGFIMALKAQAPIVPVAVQGGRDAMQKGSAFIRPVRVSVRIGEPIETAIAAALPRVRDPAPIRMPPGPAWR